jgi:hypothetical protein
MLIINLKVYFLGSIKPGEMTLLSALSPYPERETLFPSHNFERLRHFFNSSIVMLIILAIRLLLSGGGKYLRFIRLIHTSCTKQIVDFDDNAGFQSVINTAHARPQREKRTIRRNKRIMTWAAITPTLWRW